jgi:hypothetical protein
MGAVDVPYESQSSTVPGDGTLHLTVCDLDGLGLTDFILIAVNSGPYGGYSNSGIPSGNITVSSR